MAIFQVKDFLSITASMVNYMRASQAKVTDFTPGSVARSMLEAPAAEIDQLYQQMLAGLRQAIPVAVFNSFSFPALEAAPASGTVRFTITTQAAAVTIAAGTRLTREDGAVTYLTQADLTITAGNTFGDVLAVAETAGAIGNLVAGTTFTPSPSPAGFLTAAALADWNTGAEAETEAEQKVRFNGYIGSLARGTLAALRYGLSLVALRDAAGNITERVALNAIEEPWIADAVNFPPGLVNVYVHNGVGSTSPALVAEAQKVLDGYYEADGTPVPGWKAAGAKIVVIAATESATAVTASVTVAPAAVSGDVLAAVEQAFTDYLSRLGIGHDVLRAELYARAMAVPGVENITIAAPVADVLIAGTAKAMPGTMTITAA